MPIFVIFVFGAIIFGAGAMFAPAIRSYGPRIGLAGVFTLAIIVTGSIFYASLAGWNTLVIDYLWFALLVGIFLTGTMSAGMYRTEAAEVDTNIVRTHAGWPGPRELAFLAVAGLLCVIPALAIPVPLDTDAQGFGYLALMLKLGGPLHTLAPYHPEITYLYSPGFPALVAYLGSQLHAGLHNIQMGMGAVLCFLFIWTAYDFGNELTPGESRRSGIVFGLCALLSGGLLSAYLDSHFTALLGLVFGLAMLTFTIRFAREGHLLDFFGAAVTMAALPLSQPDATIILALGYGAFLLVLLLNRWMARPTPNLPFVSARRWLLMALGIPLLALVGLAPWLVKILPLLTSDIRSPFEIGAGHWQVLTVYQGGLIVVLAVLGWLVTWRRRNVLDMTMLIWLLLVIDLSSVGILKGLLPWLPIFKYDYPFSIAWHGPIVPCLYFAAQFILWAIERIGAERTTRTLRQVSLPVLGAIAVLGISAGIFADPIVMFSKTTTLTIYGAFSSRADVQAMEWLRNNTPMDTLILNHPGDHEGDWAPVIAQRNTVYFRPQPFFRHTEQVEQMQADLRQFWLDPNQPSHAGLLKKYGIRYVLVPQIINRPELLNADLFRWRPPVEAARPYLQAVQPSSYLKLIQDFDGAQIFEVVTP